MSIKVNLSSHADKFTADSYEFSVDKKVNFIFGKNGTGKTTIADEIVSQFSNNYEICVFKDFDGIAENARLDAVALGTANKEIQNKIDFIDTEIKNIEKQIERPAPEDKKTINLFTQAKETQKAYNDAEISLSKFYTTSASEIKKQSRPQLAGSGYNKNNFEYDIANAYLLSEDAITTHKTTIVEEKMSDASAIIFPEIDLQSYLESVNEIIQLFVVQPQNIPELENNVDKQDFAKLGMSIHKHENGEVCAFCGNKISNERWHKLNNYFNDEYKKLENRINNGMSVIIAGLETVENIEKLNVRDFYDKFSTSVLNINSQIETKVNEYRRFLESLKAALEEKHRNIFIISESITIETPSNFDDIKQVISDLVKNHNQWSENIESEQNKARDALRYHEVKKILDEFQYDKKNKKLIGLKAADDHAQSLLKAKANELKIKQDERKNLLSQTKDEEKIATRISDRLASMGVASFSLKLVEDDIENQKGQYQIKGHDGNIRPVTHLSKGEKNIIAFLYFIYSLESVEQSNMQKIIVFDDPMTSNDDTMQYLMMGEIQKLYQNLKDGNYLIILTHNCHFYLNVRPPTLPKYKEIKSGAGKGFYEEIGLYKKYGIYHLLYDSKRATIKSIKNGKQDFKTNYESLWKELVFLYNAKDTTADIMLNPCRKICETYLKFTKQDVMEFYAENNSAKKLFDVNQHSIDDFEAEQNGKTKDEVKAILEELFKANNAENHFNDHWKGGEQ